MSSMSFFRRLSFLAASIASSLPVTAFAEEASPQDDADQTAPSAPETRRGFQLGARLGYAFPTGQLGGGSFNTHVSDLETASVPVGLDAGLRLGPGLYVGGTVSWGPGISPNQGGPCKVSSVRCAEHDVQARAEARFYFAPQAKNTGWFAVGVGWEVATFAQSAGSYSATSTLTGPIFPDLELGVDIASRGRVALGPYFGLTVSTFVTDGVNPTAAPVATWIPNPSPHTWITLGLRGSYGP
jgi:hypothetical protein